MRDQINDKKWNGCIHFGFNGLPYAYSWYLDVVGEHWKGLVYKDYEAVFPIVWNRKWGINYMYKPPYTQQLGIFSLDPISNELIKEFYDSIPQEFKLIDIQINSKNWLAQKGYSLEEKPNFVLDLNRPYEEISKSYSGNIKRNLKRAEKKDLNVTNQVKPEVFADFYVKHTGPKVKDFSKKRYYILTRLVYNAIHYNVGFVSGILNNSDELIAACFFVFNQKFIINLAPATSDEGRTSGAMTKLIDYVVRVNENRPRFLDFEGSSIESIAKFYRGFGAQKIMYYHIKSNKLPWFMKLLKN